MRDSAYIFLEFFEVAYELATSTLSFIKAMTRPKIAKKLAAIALRRVDTCPQGSRFGESHPLHTPSLACLRRQGHVQCNSRSPC